MFHWSEGPLALIRILPCMESGAPSYVAILQSSTGDVPRTIEQLVGRPSMTLVQAAGTSKDVVATHWNGGTCATVTYRRWWVFLVER